MWSRWHPEAAVRWLPVVLVPLLLAASTFPGQYRVPWVYWMLSMAASVLFALGAQWPLAVSLLLAALAVPMFRIPAWGLSGLVPFLGAVALVDVIRRTPRNAPVLLAIVGWTAAVVIGRGATHDPGVSRATLVLEVGTYVGLPVLLGLFLRGQRELAATLRLRAAEAEMRRADAEQRTRSAEREALARELHDLVAHHMASIVLRIGVARHVLADAGASTPDARTFPDGSTTAHGAAEIVVSESEAVEPHSSARPGGSGLPAVLDDVHGTAAAALADIRRLLTALRDPALGEVALVDAEAVRTEIGAAADRVRAAGFDVRAEIRASVAGLDAIGRLTLLRLVQESLTNVMKHADPARPVLLTVDDADGGIALTVRSGRHERRANAGTGHGIIGMRERVELAGGRLAIDGADPAKTDHGGREHRFPADAAWTVRAWLPNIPTQEAGR
ncbi:histidine kinase [Nocardia sp. NPDC005978]|uniref:sensor histidine kinase n=1 Tax=Nocardia sp. NPDC005978 TaxID=3156725 RepID=UPI0033BDDADE